LISPPINTLLENSPKPTLTVHIFQPLEHNPRNRRTGGSSLVFSKLRTQTKDAWVVLLYSNPDRQPESIRQTYALRWGIDDYSVAAAKQAEDFDEAP
jgi:hypothetical protein